MRGLDLRNDHRPGDDDGDEEDQHDQRGEALAGASRLKDEIATSYHGKPAWCRAVADHIAGMTDGYCLKEHERIFAARPEKGG